MDKLADLVIHRLSGYYSWASVHNDKQQVEPMRQPTDKPLVVLQLQDNDENEAKQRLLEIQQLLNAIQVESWIRELQQQHSLLISREDELAAGCCLKGAGIALTTAYTDTEFSSENGNP